MNKEQIEQNIKNMELEIAKMKDELNKSAEVKMFPQKTERYWTFFANGMINNENFAIDNDGRINAYKTKEEAEKARDIAFAKMRLKHAIEVANEGWRPNWEDETNKYIYRLYDANNIKIDFWSSNKYQPTWMYMKSREIAEQILSEHKEDIKLVLGE